MPCDTGEPVTKPTQGTVLAHTGAFQHGRTIRASLSVSISRDLEVRFEHLAKAGQVLRGFWMPLQKGSRVIELGSFMVQPGERLRVVVAENGYDGIAQASIHYE